jgi:cGMP-dependent protein kinase 1
MGCATSRAVPVATGGYPPDLDQPLVSEGNSDPSPQNTQSYASPSHKPSSTSALRPLSQSSSSQSVLKSGGKGATASDLRTPSVSRAAGDQSIAIALKSKRAGVRVEGTDVHLDANYIKPVIPKEVAVKDMIRSALQNNALFSALGSSAIEDIVDAMESKSVSVGVTIINQGEPGDNFYVIESGTFDIIVNGKKVADWGEGTKNRAVGELALMYNSPRAATVTASTDAIVWQIGRQTFRSVIAQSAYQTHQHMKEFLKRGLLEDLSDAQLDKVADSASRISFKRGDQIIKKGEAGEVFYVIEKGSVVCKNLPGEQSDNVLHAGDYFGERALLRQEPRACDVFAESDLVLIALAREDFEGLLGHLRELLEHNLGMRLLLCVPVLSQLKEDERNMLFSQLRVTSFKDGQTLIAQGSAVTQFFIIREGTIVVKHGDPNSSASTTTSNRPAGMPDFSKLRVGSKLNINKDLTPPTVPNSSSSPSISSLTNSSTANGFMGYLTAGQWFGEAEVEKGLPSEVTYAAHGHVECFILDARTYVQLLAPYLRGLKASHLSSSPTNENTTPNTTNKGSSPQSNQHVSERKLDDGGGLTLRSVDEKRLPSSDSSDATMQNELPRSRPISTGRKRLGIPFEELEQHQTLGTGTFGRVRIVLHRKTNRAFALKMLKKAQIVALKQQNNIVSEKDILWKIDHPFIISLYDTYQDEDRLYMLMELVQGGELFARLQNSVTPGRVTPAEARFYAACVLDALEHLHSMNIVYRDLKPENLLIDADGYMKIVDFGFAKVVEDRTYTLCGTPEYLAPELVLGKGHDRGVDYWALGILLYECVSGYSPFADQPNNDQMVICRNILKGEVVFPPHVQDKDLKDLILKLLVRDVPKRLGCQRGGAQDIKNHKFMRAIDFDDLYSRKIQAPWVPPIRNQLDSSNFDEYDEEDPIEDDPVQDDSWASF